MFRVQASGLFKGELKYFFYNLICYRALNIKSFSRSILENGIFLKYAVTSLCSKRHIVYLQQNEIKS